MWNSSSSSSSSSSPYAANLRLPKTMEEVWKDITLTASDIHHHPSSRGIVLQDFFSRDPPPTSASSPGFSASPTPPPTLLTLSSGCDHHFGRLLLQPHHQIQPMSHVSSISAAFEAVVPDHNAGGGIKRLPENDRNSGDRRHKRMIKNRESAARSRARKQAYTNELELEVAHLLEENARLKKQQEQFFREAAALQKRKPLHRTSTAPF